MTHEGTECFRFGPYKGQDYNRLDQQWFDCTLHGATTLERCRACPDHKRLDFPKFELAAGITTAERPGKVNYLDGTGFSLANSFHLINGTVLIGNDDDKRLGPFGMFYLVATELYIRHPHASAYLISQDDVTYNRFSGEIVAALGADTSRWAVLSLYTAPELSEAVQQAKPKDGMGNWRQIDKGWNSPGACAYVFSDWALRDFLTDPVVLWHRRFGPTNGWRGLDSVVGVFAARFAGIWHHTPPLAHHVGVVSTITREDQPERDRYDR